MNFYQSLKALIDENELMCLMNQWVKDPIFDMLLDKLINKITNDLVFK